MLMYLRLFLRVNCLLQLELVIRYGSRQAIHPIRCGFFERFAALAVLHENSVFVRVDIGTIDIYGYDACLYLAGEAVVKITIASSAFESLGRQPLRYTFPDMIEGRVLLFSNASTSLCICFPVFAITVL